jgi:hypothetical protein
MRQLLRDFQTLFMIIYIAFLVNIESTWVSFNKKSFLGYAKMTFESIKQLAECSFVAVGTGVPPKKSKKRSGLRSRQTICRAQNANAGNSGPEKPKTSSRSSKKDSKSPTVTNGGAEVVDVTCLNYPGVYEILDVKNNKSYYGETSLLGRRFMHHFQGLLNDNNDCRALADAFKEQNKQIENFRFLVHKSGPEWQDRNLRLAYEAELINTNRHRSYNTEQEKPTLLKVRKPVMYEGTVYSSAREASKALNIGRTSILRRVASDQWPNVYYIETQDYGFCPIFAKQNNGWSVLFKSMADCVNAKYATNVQNARRKIQRKEEGWRYAHFDKKDKPLRIPYSLKENEVSYEQYCEMCSFVFLVNFILEKSK